MTCGDRAALLSTVSAAAPSLTSLHPSSSHPSSASPSPPSSSSSSPPSASPRLSFAETRASYGLLGTVASFLLPLFRPFRHALGLDALALSDLLYRRAVVASTPALMASYSLSVNPLTNLSPLTTLHMFLTHSALSSLVLAAPGSPQWSRVLRATLEAWWMELAGALGKTVGEMRQSGALREQQQQIMGFFRALDLALKWPTPSEREAVLCSVLHTNLYGDPGVHGQRYALEVATLSTWLQGQWAKAQGTEGGESASVAAGRAGLPFTSTPPPLLHEGGRAGAEREMRWVQYAIETEKGPERLVLVQPTAADAHSKQHL